MTQEKATARPWRREHNGRRLEIKANTGEWSSMIAQVYKSGRCNANSYRMPAEVIPTRQYYFLPVMLLLVTVWLFAAMGWDGLCLFGRGVKADAKQVYAWATSSSEAEMLKLQLERNRERETALETVNAQLQRALDYERAARIRELMRTEPKRCSAKKANKCVPTPSQSATSQVSGRLEWNGTGFREWERR